MYSEIRYVAALCNALRFYYCECRYSNRGDDVHCVQKKTHFCFLA